MRLLTTGAAGFIGSRLCELAAAQGHEVIGLSRSGAAAHCALSRRWSLGEDMPCEGLDHIDCAVHLAHDFDGEAGAKRTIEGTLLAAAQLRAAGARRQIYVSSCSAGAEAVSLYGKTKHELEKSFAPYEDVILVRPGLALGSGGLFGRIRKWAQILPLIPLPDGGAQKTPHIDIDKLCRLLLEYAQGARKGREANLFEPERKSLRELVLAAAAEKGKKPLILPLPSGFVRFCLSCAEALRIPLPVTTDNLDGLTASLTIIHHSSLQ